MYFYYEEFDNVTMIVLSSNGRDTKIARSDKTNWACVELCTRPGGLFKQIPLASRDFNDATKVWTFIGHYGKVITTNLESMCLQGLFRNSQVKKIEDLEDKATRGALNEIKKKDPVSKIKPEDFFYNPHAVQSSSEISGPTLVARLAPLLSLTRDELAAIKDDKILKKHYRVAALKFHPDRNEGDGSKMSELNMLWGIYTSQGV